MFQNCQNSNRQEIAYSTNGSAGYDTALTPHAVKAICADVSKRSFHPVHDLSPGIPPETLSSAQKNRGLTN